MPKVLLEPMVHPALMEPKVHREFRVFRANRGYRAQTAPPVLPERMEQRVLQGLMVRLVLRAKQGLPEQTGQRGPLARKVESVLQVLLVQTEPMVHPERTVL